MNIADLDRKLLTSRTELLDIGMRNSLLSFRQGAKSLSVVQEGSEDVLQQMYRQGKAAKLVSVQGLNSDQEKEENDGTLLAELDTQSWAKLMSGETEDGKQKNHSSNKLHIALSPEILLSKLLKIETEARGFIEEQGVNVLYLALGFLHWHETATSEEVRKAPLILLPVNLVRGHSREAFSLRYTGDDLNDNLSLDAKLHTDFGIRLPIFLSDFDGDPAELPNVTTYYRQVETVIQSQPRWKVQDNEIALGFFSFGKFLMFNDLDPKNWPDDKQPAQHPVMQRLLGDGFYEEKPALPESVRLDDVIQPGDVCFVKDADSSQTEAILEARAGNNLVIQGPPGTGKSQTITNIIADQLSQGKTVLFVAEKMAALDVVKRRLDESLLGDAVLELHSHKATKKSVLAELERTLAQGRPCTERAQEDFQALNELTINLNGYCDAVNIPDPISGLQFIQVVGQYLSLRRTHAELAPLPFAPMARWSSSDFVQQRTLVDELAHHIEAMGTPKQNLFWGSKHTHFSPVEQDKAATALREARRLLAYIAQEAEGLSERLCLTHPTTIADIDVVCRAARRAAEAPRLQGLCLSTQDWQLRRDTIQQLLDAGSKMTKAKDDYGDQVIDSAWEQNLQEVRQHFANYGHKWWRGLSGKFRQARAKLQGLCKDTLTADNVHNLSLIDGIMSFQQHKRVYDQLESLGAALFGAQWNSQRSDWPVLQHLAGWVIKLHDDCGKGNIPQGLLDFLSGHADASGLGDTISTIEEQLAGLQSQLADIAQILNYQDDTVASIYALPLTQGQEKLAAWIEGLPQIYNMARFNVLSDQLQKAGLFDILAFAASQPLPQRLLPCFDLTWYAGLVERAYAQYPMLRQFDRIQHEHQIQRFKTLDNISFDHAKQHLAKQLWERMPNINQPGEMAVIRTELNKKRKHIPIRQLIRNAGHAIQQIKPVMMMSPMSIANFLPPGQLEFDVVIFDEASQVKTVDAFGAILRGRQVIVVGDTRQMPPSDFFGRDIALEDEDSVTADIESVLSMFKMAGAQERYLRWHYRSRHESLIAVSNAEFYDNKLVVFPSPGRNSNATGLKLHHLPQAIYDRGRTRTNRIEAQAVASAVMEHARTRSTLSLGVVAFSVAQRDLIQMELELRRREQPELDAFFSTQAAEPFFIKNLENVQGDERDVIIISIGYGRNESGRIAKEFGPVNRDGGHRRLNVLITRAKLGMEVFCNFLAEDLELDANAPHGVRALKHFLRYAETGELAIARETGKAPDSIFEEEVIFALQQKGYSVEPQVGASGYFIDIGVKDPLAPGQYLLAIECDGATYHSSRSARDRDRLRQGVLEGLGWRFHRIWSTDWFRNPEQETARAVAAIEAARLSPPLASDNRAPQSVLARETTEVKLATAITTARPYFKATLPSRGGSLPDEDTPTLIAMIRAVLKVETPIHQTDMIRRLMDAYGVKRMGSQIETAVIAAIYEGSETQQFDSRGEFIYLDANSPITLRDRTGLSASEKKIEHVSPEELDLAVSEVVRKGFTISVDEVIAEVLDLLGFGRATNKIKQAVNSRIDEQIREGRLEGKDGKLMIATEFVE